ncbi:WAT1-related protein [Citrus sinensis]|nr:WAT1-related protein [Citrus sinensis]
MFLTSPSTHSKPLLQWPLCISLSNWVTGGFLLIAQCLLNSIWYILQAHIIKIYPAELVVVSLYLLCASIISVPACLMAEQDLSAWRLKTDVALVSVVLSGFFGSSFSTLVHTWGLHLKGPVYIAIFKPLSIAIAAIMGVVFLGDTLHLGSVIGAIIICIGFYAVLWGKANEEGTTYSSDSKTPLLQSLKVEDTETN